MATGLTPGVTYYFLVRAVDRSPQRNEDWNTVTLSATVLGGGSVPAPNPPPPPPPPPAGGSGYGAGGDGVDGSPWTGVAASIPGRVECENYDLGGRNIAYYDTTEGNQGGAYRSDDVDLEVCSEGGYDLTWTVSGEVVEYTVCVYIYFLLFSSSLCFLFLHLFVSFFFFISLFPFSSSASSPLWGTVCIYSFFFVIYFFFCSVVDGLKAEISHLVFNVQINVVETRAYTLQVRVSSATDYGWFYSEVDEIASKPLSD